MISPTKAVILAAGIGKRLGGGDAQPPKCLMKFGGKSLLQRHLEILSRLGVKEVSFGVGYRAQQLEAALHEIDSPLYIDFAYNPDYRKGSIVTLWVARDHLQTGSDVLLMDADVLYDDRILERLIKTEHHNCFLLDRNLEPGEEPVKLCVKQGRLVEFRKRIDVKFDFYGESVGFFRFSQQVVKKLITALKSYIEAERFEEHYEEAIRDVLLKDPTIFGYEEVTGLPWIEIDFPKDVLTAQNSVLPQLVT